MNIKEALDKENKRHERVLRITKLVEEKELEPTVNFCTGDTMFLNYSDDFTGTLRLYAEKLGKYKQRSYHVSCESMLAVVYSFEAFDVDVQFYVSISLIDKISSGKCKIEDRQITEKIVVCDIK